MELISPVRVVVVDDRPEHLFAIANALAVTGIPCVWHLYDKRTNSLAPPPPDGGYCDIRLLITDLNVRDVSSGGSDPKNLAGILLSDVLLPLLPARACPYSLVLWSNVQVKAEEVGEFISERIDHPNSSSADRRPAPLSVGLMDKNKFVSTVSASGATADLVTLMVEGASKVAEIRAQLEAVLDNAQLRLVCAWETRVSKAAASTVNSVYDAATIHAVRAEMAPSQAFGEVLAKLALEAAGLKDAKEWPARALDDGLVDLFVDDLRATDSDDDYLPLVQASIGKILAGAPPKLDSEVRSRLNTELHVETKVAASVKRTIRGLMLGADDQTIVAGYVGQKSASGIIWPEFLIGVDEFKKAFDDAAKAGSADSGRLEELYKRAVADKKDVEALSRVLLLEVGADCDHAQRKARTIRLLCALEVPERFSYFLHPPGNPHSLKSESLVKFGPWSFAGSEPIVLLVSVGRFSIHQTWPLPERLEPKYRLRKPLVDSVLHKYTSYSSRPGYVAITG